MHVPQMYMFTHKTPKRIYKQVQHIVHPVFIFPCTRCTFCVYGQSPRWPTSQTQPFLRMAAILSIAPEWQSLEILERRRGEIKEWDQKLVLFLRAGNSTVQPYKYAHPYNYSRTNAAIRPLMRSNLLFLSDAHIMTEGVVSASQPKVATLTYGEMTSHGTK